MNDTIQNISHPGIIQSIDAHSIKIRIESAAACGSCIAKGSCGMAEMEDKVIEVIQSDDTQYTVGQYVTVSMKQTLGSLAVVLGYVVPFTVVLLTLIIMLQLGFSEGVSGLVSLGILAPYYLVLHLCRNLLKKTFRFYISSL
jgi:sigma-E factor negative regulatory protein RseC